MVGGVAQAQGDQGARLRQPLRLGCARWPCRGRAMEAPPNSPKDSKRFTTRVPWRAQVDRQVVVALREAEVGADAELFLGAAGAAQQIVVGAERGVEPNSAAHQRVALLRLGVGARWPRPAPGPGTPRSPASSWRGC